MRPPGAPRGARHAPSGAWTLEDAERYLFGLELFGMRFGLDRMRRLSTTLGLPQQRFGSIHVVGTNGKSSTTRMVAAILEGHGLRTGAYLSPHLISFCERVRVGGRDAQPPAFAAAVARAAHAAGLVDRTLAPDDHVTQFEALTAAAFSELARQNVEAAVIEAGLGGRFDATNVIDSRVQVLTNVGLEHTRWLGPTVSDIAAEKLDVVRPGGVLVLGAGLHPDAETVAAEVARRRGARVLRAPADCSGLVDGAAPLLAGGRFQRRNFALAATAARAYLQEQRGPDFELEPAAVARAAATTDVPGRFHVVAEHPLTVLDGAHNAEGVAALVESLDDLLGACAAGPRSRSPLTPLGPGRGGREAARRPLCAAVSILEDKDAAGMLAQLVPRATELVFTRADNPRALPPATLASLARQLGAPTQRLEPDPSRALALARELAGADGVAVATGSIYLVADLLRARQGARA